MRPDRLTAVARDLTLLAGVDRRAILAALDRDDRERVLQAMRGGRTPASPEPSASPHSLWLERRIAQARAGDCPAMTAAARAALIDAADRGSVAFTASRLPGRTLLQAASGLLAPGRAR